MAISAWQCTEGIHLVTECACYHMPCFFRTAAVAYLLIYCSLVSLVCTSVDPFCPPPPFRLPSVPVCLDDDRDNAVARLFKRQQRAPDGTRSLQGEETCKIL